MTLRSRIHSTLLGLTVIAFSSQSLARWEWDSRTQDERAMLEEHSAMVLTAYEGFKGMGKRAEAPFDPDILALNIDTLETLLGNDVPVPNEQHYVALIERIRNNIDDRYERFEYELASLASSTDPQASKRLQRVLSQEYFLLPALLKVSKRREYRGLEARLKAGLGP